MVCWAGPLYLWAWDQDHWDCRLSLFCSMLDKFYWTHGYVLISEEVEDCVPVFLKHIAQDVYICGKTINLLKLCCPRVRGVREGGTVVGQVCPGWHLTSGYWHVCSHAPLHGRQEISLGLLSCGSLVSSLFQDGLHSTHGISLEGDTWWGMSVIYSLTGGRLVLWSQQECHCP
jgi:hypothetical protein